MAAGRILSTPDKWQVSDDELIQGYHFYDNQFTKQLTDVKFQFLMAASMNVSSGMLRSVFS
jgi:hypothetical protein